MATTWKNSLRTTLGSKVRVFEKAVRTDESGKKVTVFMLRRSQEQDAAAAGGAAAAGHLQATAAARADGVAAPAAPLPLHHESLGELLSALRLARDSPSRPSLLRGAAVPSFELAMDSRVRAFPACVPRADCLRGRRRPARPRRRQRGGRRLVCSRAGRCARRQRCGGGDRR